METLIERIKKLRGTLQNEAYNNLTSKAIAAAAFTIQHHTPASIYNSTLNGDRSKANSFIPVSLFPPESYFYMVDELLSYS